MRALGIALLTGLSLAATTPREDFRALSQVASATYPGKTHYAVVCDYRSSKADVDALAEALGDGHLITVVDLHHKDQIGAAGAVLLQRHPDLLVLLPHDRVVRDGAFEATILVQSMKARDLATLGTTATALRQGAAWAIGEGTKGELMVDPALRGIVGPVTGTQPAVKRAAGGGRAEIVFAKF